MAGSPLSHVDQHQRPAMVDISHKTDSQRVALAETTIQLPNALRDYIQGDDFLLKKGAVLQTAILAGTMAVKKTSDLIPLCHSLPIEACQFHTHIDDVHLVITLQCEVKTTYKTGVEMEALCGVSVAALTIYDMCKSVSPEIIISQTRLLKKTGGQSNMWVEPIYGLVLTGGNSQRMGQDKALIDYHGLPHAQFLHKLLMPYCDQVFLSARLGQWQGTVLETLPTLVDGEDSVGPFSGILTALETYPKVKWLILACDLVHVQASLIERLLDQAHSSAIATCFRNPEYGFPEALCGLYTPKIRPFFQRAKVAKIHCPVKIVQMAGGQLIDPPDVKAVANINTPDELNLLNSAGG